MSKFRYLSLSVLTVGLMAPMSWGAYMTSFEAPTFTNGQSAARDNWTVSSGVTVTNTTASEGLQSVSVPNVSGTSNNIRALQRTFSSTEATSADHTLSFDFRPDTTTDANKVFAWFYLYSDGTGGSMQIKLYNAPTNGTPYMTFSLLGPHNDQTQTAYVPDGTWTHEQWNTMTAMIDVSQHVMNFTINGHANVASVPVPVDSKTFPLFWAVTNNYGGSLYIDNVRLTPEPASFALVGLGGAMMLMRRRRKS